MLRWSPIIILLFALLSLSGCKTVGETKDITQKQVDEVTGEISGNKSLASQSVARKSSQTLQDLPRGFEGAWVVQLSCDSRPGMNSNIEYGLLEIEKDGGSSYKADFFVFEVQKDMYNSRMLGSIIKMEGQSTNGGSEIQLNGDKWLLKSNRANPISFNGTLSEGGFFLKGKVIGDSSCPTFIASKFPENNSTVRNPVYALDDLLDEFTSKRRNPLDQKQCTDLFEWIGSGKSEVVVEKTRTSPRISVNSIMFDEEGFVRHFGKTYANWTSEDSKAFSFISSACERSLNQNYRKLRNSPLKKAHDKYKRAGGMPFLSVAKDKKNSNTNQQTPKKIKIFFMFSDSVPNIRWANNYFILGAVKSAKLYEKILYQRLEELDSSELSLTKIMEFKKFSDFPLNYLPTSDMSSFKSYIVSIFNKKQNEYEEALYQKLEKLDSSAPSLAKLKGYQEYIDFPRNILPVANNGNFKSKVVSLYKNRQAEHVEKFLLAFNFDQYPKTLRGIKSLLEASLNLRIKIQALVDIKKRKELNVRYEEMISGHSLAASQEVIGNIVNASLTPAGFVDLVNYIDKVKSVDNTYLLPEHQASVNNSLLATKEKFFVDFYEGMAQWVAENVPDGEEGLEILNDAAEKLLGVGLLELDMSNAEVSVKQNIAYEIEKEVIKRQNSCDLLASHPADNGKSKYISGVSDIKLDVSLAIDACIASVEMEPNNIRFGFQLGRALFVAQLYDDAYEYIEEASNSGYAPANFYLAEYYSKGLNSVDQDIDKSIELYKLASNDGFLPAYVVLNRFRAELQSDINQRKKEEKERLRIARAKFKLDKIMLPVIAGEFEGIRHGLGMAYIIEVTASLYKACDSGISMDDLKAMSDVIFEKNARGFIDYLQKPAPRNKLVRLLMYNPAALEKTGPNMDVDKLNLLVLQDMALFLGKYGCSGEMYDKFMTNSKKFILGPDVPPYNLTSEPFWNVCMDESKNPKTTKKRFCSCFLPKVRDADVNRKLAKNLYTNFWPTAQSIINNPENNLRRCTVPSKSRF